ncbi:hypothetical protein [Leeuwenhoekiella palythoae]|uniref:Uncharacterized protein n=1 Tax=Leeuwenhoekiella palythoae TaxID=573501 RepID=A0A1M5YA84_9FLAO|nr:hypothetical protein [Leeuwenhoekiella palythoae]MEC7784395.1 hypothetical protein [Bacteroidota bacterium]MEE3146452.1 hypothetical protein [Bacteroidota bacterium]RXG30600.1 hypothetical protein DSM01_1351 [Leeuwenhoekiella palythoae]SHI08990.1 hypothetical protein SAMN04487999_2059 [Leeuwenhoekiella palythoae]|tara:strand:- start:311 stop:436 length:126 start_codon:yes stop_codon:yes gene_type:complete
MSDKSKNDKKEDKKDIDKGPIKDDHKNQYGSTKDRKKKRRA